MTGNEDARLRGWSHDEAKCHTLIERLLERCSTYAQDFMPCPEQGDDLPPADWCERCLAAAALATVEELTAAAEYREATSLSRAFRRGQGRRAHCRPGRHAGLAVSGVGGRSVETAQTWCVAYDDPTPRMDGPASIRVGRFHSLTAAQQALALVESRSRQAPKRNLRVETRWVTPWVVVPPATTGGETNARGGE